MRLTEFWVRMDDALGPAYSRSWASMYVLGDLGSRTVDDALAAGMSPKEVWTAVWRVLELPPNKK